MATDSERTESIRSDYDRIADEYALRLFDELEHKPFDRQILDRFAAQLAQGGEVLDIGCGPGQVARYLSEAGVSAFGLDLSARMVEHARRLNPGIAFREGDMFALDLPNESVAGIVAFYAIVNIPDDLLPDVFREMRRVLRPGGLLLLAFHIGDEVLHPQEIFGLPISMEFFMFQPSAIAQLLNDAGFVVEEVLERQPYAPEVEYQSRRAYIFAARSGKEHSIK
jgi:SAM-dependent methyltransferase